MLLLNHAELLFLSISQYRKYLFNTALHFKGLRCIFRSMVTPSSNLCYPLILEHGIPTQVMDI